MVFSSRLDAIAADAGLLEKSLSDLESLAAVLHDGCLEAESHHQERMSQQAEGEPGQPIPECTQLTLMVLLYTSMYKYSISCAIKS